MNLLLFIVTATLLGVLLGTEALKPDDPGFGANMIRFLLMGATLNLVLLAFNLLPVPPLDGWRILEGLSFKIRMLTNHPNAPIAGLFFLMVVFLTGAFDWMFAASNHVAWWWVSGAAKLVS